MKLLIEACIVLALIASQSKAADPGCPCGDNCTCAPGVCPNRCPVQFVAAPYATAAITIGGYTVGEVQVQRPQRTGGPIRRWLHARRNRESSTCGPAPVAASGPQTVASQPFSACPGGKCQVEKRGFGLLRR